MRAGLDLRQSPRPRTALLPALRQGAALLRLSTVELAETLARQADEMPALELHAPAAGWRGAVPAEPAAPVSLAESLSWQIGLMALDPAIARRARALIGELDENGFLDRPPGEIARAEGIAPAEVSTALEALRACEPAGIAAHDAADSLRLQLLAEGVEGELAAALTARLDLVAAGRIGALARALGVGRARAAGLARQVAGLSPRPAAAYAPPAPALIPELTVEEDGQGGLAVRFLDVSLPALRLDPAIAAAAAGDAALRARLVDPARAVIAALGHRRRTLLAIATEICRRQHRFFRDGEGALMALSRREVATAIGRHPATVGRAVRGVALGWRGRAVPLSVFFPPPLPAAGGTVSAAAARARLAQLVSGEAPGEALSDAALAERLGAEGVKISRRAVAKYRVALGVADSHARNRAARRRGR